MEEKQVLQVSVEDNVPDKNNVGKTRADFDSGWTYDQNSSYHIVSFEHNFGQIPSEIVLWFSPDKEEVYPLLWSWHNTRTGNPITISMNERFIKLVIVAGHPLHGAYDPGTRTWSLFNGGYWRIFANR